MRLSRFAKNKMRTNAEDVEKGFPEEYLAGYPDFAAFIASTKDFAVFRSFNRLSARNILYLQSELLYLQSQLDNFDQEDSSSRDISQKAAARCWRIFANPDPNGETYEHDQKRLELVLRIRPLLKEYSMQFRQRETHRGGANYTKN
ncbi:MAG: hypothetical protein M1840_002497 [Geoglossum simile]|nr:MAG: hypothetical protein M1840_002497 [Geoglossum simile]